MATIEELEHKAAAIEAAESSALAALVDGLRDLAVQLPDGSQLAVLFAKGAKSMEPWADPDQLGRSEAAGRVSFLQLLHAIENDRGAG
jgi:hypothetical protein